MSPRIIFWGDPHIAKMNKLLGIEKGMSLHKRLLQSQLQFSIKEKATHVIILGDLFDTPFPSQDDLSLVVGELTKAKQYGIRFLVLRGNHDIHNAEHDSLKLLSQLPEAGALTHVKFITTTKLLSWAGINILAIPYGAKIIGIDRNPDLIVFHDSVIGAKNDNNHLVTEGIAPETFKGIMAVGGHIHTEQHIGKWIHYPGTQAQLKFSELKGNRIGLYENGRVYSMPFESPWRLKTVVWDVENPPICNEPNTYYRLMITDSIPGPKWTTQNPQVVKTEGGDRKAISKKVVSLIAGEKIPGEENNEDIKRYLKTYSNLDQISIMRAVRIHERLKNKD